jgi:hypothetical protein
MATSGGNEPSGARRRRVLPGGVIEEWDAAMGRVRTIPADPGPREIDLSADAPGWERLRAWLERRRR